MSRNLFPLFRIVRTQYQNGCDFKIPFISFTKQNVSKEWKYRNECQPLSCQLLKMYVRLIENQHLLLALSIIIFCWFTLTFNIYNFKMQYKKLSVFFHVNLFLQFPIYILWIGAIGLMILEDTLLRFAFFFFIFHFNVRYIIDWAISERKYTQNSLIFKINSWKHIFLIEFWKGRERKKKPF